MLESLGCVDLWVFYLLAHSFPIAFHCFDTVAVANSFTCDSWTPWRTPGLEWASNTGWLHRKRAVVLCFSVLNPSVLCYCWFGDWKGIWSVRSSASKFCRSCNSKKNWLVKQKSKLIVVDVGVVVAARVLKIRELDREDTGGIVSDRISWWCAG